MEIHSQIKLYTYTNSMYSIVKTINILKIEQVGSETILNLSDGRSVYKKHLENTIDKGPNYYAGCYYTTYDKALIGVKAHIERIKDIHERKLAAQQAKIDKINKHLSKLK